MLEALSRRSKAAMRSATEWAEGHEASKLPELFSSPDAESSTTSDLPNPVSRFHESRPATTEVESSD